VSFFFLPSGCQAKCLKPSPDPFARYAFSLIFSNRITIFSNRRFCWPAISRFFQNDITIFSNGISRLFQTDFLREISGTSYGFRALKLMKQGLIRAKYHDYFNRLSQGIV
jgi:hypothetical protein